MVTAVSVHRGTPTLTVAPTQNTAPVHEFRCLYTRDLHKKAKKWHDGSLRFHTFNRRVMVYDDAKNYIGDLHYTKEEEFGEGVEIQLDRGVKVEVGERLGETETDLAPILERQRPEKATPQKRLAGGFGAHSVSSNPSQRPKSLLEVLGPSQGRLGRSRLPLQSPYEQRQATFRPEPNEPHPKRRRLSNDKENYPEKSARLVRPGKACLPQPVRSSKPDRSPLVQKAPPTRPRPVVEISSDEESDHARRTQPRASVMSSFETPRAIAKSQRACKPTPTLQERKTSKMNTLKAQIPRQIPRDTAEQLVPESKTRATLTRPRVSIQRRARLLLGRPRPKSKLTVLQPFVRADSRPCAGTPVGRASTPEGAHSPSPLSPVPEAELDIVPRRTCPESSRQHDYMSTPRQSTVECIGPDMVASSPLFLPEDETWEPKSTSPPPLPTQEEFPFLGMSKDELEQHERLESTHPSFVQEGTSMEQESQSAPELDTANVFSSGTLPAQGLQEPQAASIIAKVPPSLIPHTREFRRVFSENDVVLEDDAAQNQNPGQTNLEFRSPLKILDDLSTRRTPKKAKSPQKFQRCASDTAALNDPIEDFPIQEHGREDQQEGQTGPWTSDEAFLLFDWWPPEMEKPEYWAATVRKKPCANPVAVPAAAAGGAAAISGYPTMITTARQFLRDDIYAS